MDFLELKSVLAIHDRQLSEHGGIAGVRDAGLLDSAIARPMNKHAYGIEDIFELAAAYAFGISRNHPFLDGNKRTAWVCTRVFLRLIGISFKPDRIEAIEQMVRLAEGALSEDAFADWLRRSSAAR